jgi:hypothetical protein
MNAGVDEKSVVLLAGLQVTQHLTHHRNHYDNTKHSKRSCVFVKVLVLWNQAQPIKRSLVV